MRLHFSVLLTLCILLSSGIKAPAIIDLRQTNEIALTRDQSPGLIKRIMIKALIRKTFRATKRNKRSIPHFPESRTLKIILTVIAIILLAGAIFFLIALSGLKK